MQMQGFGFGFGRANVIIYFLAVHFPRSSVMITSSAVRPRFLALGDGRGGDSIDILGDRPDNRPKRRPNYRPESPQALVVH